MARPLALVAAVVVSLLAVSGAGGADAQTPKRGGTVVFGAGAEPTCLSPVDASCAQPGFLEEVLSRHSPSHPTPRDGRDSFPA